MWANDTLGDIAGSLTNSVAADGQTVMTADLNMGNNKISNLGPGVFADDSVSLSQSQNGAYLMLSFVTGADAITASLVPALTSYEEGQQFRFVSVGANTGAVTLDIDGIGPVAVTKLSDEALIAGDIPDDTVVEVTYTGTTFRLTNLAASFATTATTATTSAGVTGLTLGRALISSTVTGNLVVSATTATEISYLQGVTSAIQTQINGISQWPGVYTGTSITNTSFPVGSYVMFVNTTERDRNSTVDVGYAGGNDYQYAIGATDLSGTWRARGYGNPAGYPVCICQRTS